MITFLLFFLNVNFSDQHSNSFCVILILFWSFLQGLLYFLFQSGTMSYHFICFLLWIYCFETLQLQKHNKILTNPFLYQSCLLVILIIHWVQACLVEWLLHHFWKPTFSPTLKYYTFSSIFAHTLNYFFSQFVIRFLNW